MSPQKRVAFVGGHLAVWFRDADDVSVPSGGCYVVASEVNAAASEVTSTSEVGESSVECSDSGSDAGYSVVSSDVSDSAVEDAVSSSADSDVVGKDSRE